MSRWAVCLLVLLAGCSAQPAAEQQVSRAQDLESAAIERGVIADPRTTDLDGLFARDTDRLCVVGKRLGVSVDYGDGVSCNGQGSVARSGSDLKVTLAGGCAFEASWDGRRIIFPATLPTQCAALCRGRASLAALNVERLSESVAEAAAMRDARGKLPCGS